jgi:hypothetical protein
MRYSLDLSSDDPKEWKLLHDGEPAGTLTSRPGSFDNAHMEFWQYIKELESQIEHLLEDLLVEVSGLRDHEEACADNPLNEKNTRLFQARARALEMVLTILSNRIEARTND